MVELMITCDKVTYLVDLKELKPLSFKEKLNLRIHTAMCKCCKNYETDSKVLLRLLKRLNHSNSELNLSPAEKKEMQKKLNS